MKECIKVNYDYVLNNSTLVLSYPSLIRVEVYFDIYNYSGLYLVLNRANGLIIGTFNSLDEAKSFVNDYFEDCNIKE